MERTNPTVTAIAGILRGLQARRNLRQVDLAEVSGVSQSQVSKILRGTREPSLSQLDSIAGALGTTVPDLWAEAEEEATA